MLSGSIRSFRPGDEPRLREVMEASLRLDGIPGFEPADIDRSLSRVPADPDGCLIAEQNGRIVGYCIPRHDDLTVHPDFRRRGHGRRLVEAARRLVRERGLPYLALHTPTHLPGTVAFAEAVGARYHSSLWLFSLPPDVPIAPPRFPPDVVTSTLALDADLEAFTRLMNETFADHPTPLSWTVENVRLVAGLPEFDPDAVLLVAPAGERDRPIAFTRVELSTDAAGVADGWITAIGVLPAWRGRGLGRALLAWGVGHLRAGGAGRIELSAQALNARATEIYRRAGFVPTIEWPHYVLDA